MVAKRKQKKDDFLEELWWETAEGILKKLKSKSCTSADVTNAMKMLKDNGITVADPADSPLPEFLDVPIPDFSDHKYQS